MHKQKSCLQVVFTWGRERYQNAFIPYTLCKLNLPIIKETEATAVIVMLSENLKVVGLPSTDELACSDDIPVDNEDQNFLPNILLFLLTSIWATRTDWFFGVDMAIYHTTGANARVPIVPDGFLSLGVDRKKGGKSRRSYAVWEENEVVPILVLEMVSHSPGSEYDEKLEIYRKLGVLYYIIYNPEYWQRDRHQPFEIYKLANPIGCQRLV